MYQDNDFLIVSDEFRFKKDTYPLLRIHNAKVKKLSYFDNFGQILFWLFIFSGMTWVATLSSESVPFWLQALVSSLTLIGFIFGLSRCSRYALQIEFCHSDETGTQWITVAKSYSRTDKVLFETQVKLLKDTFA
ncbi:hypothetical protein L1D34_26520 [Vibrio mediterranei]|jgi:hypothetical protein|uniref:hypothetical protein n=1 Tax=Vibrio mediterranei TaxID=689 RepID=UPI001EFD8552|nr:hypothetical protein [Vibrio mediterranei]MCG9628379.1 hypothetical protein [Vibrio mediterranei]MCY9855692.1 hypothetical protein [Vibrio mediterranei]